MEISKNKIVNFNWIFIVSSIFMVELGIDVGFVIKPYMIINILVFISIFCILKLKLNTCIYRYEVVFLIFYIYSSIRGVFSYNPYMSFRLMIGMAICIALYITVYNIVYLIDIEKVIKGLTLSSIIFILISLILYLLKVDGSFAMDKGFYRMQGLTSDPNIMCIYITPIYLISLNNLIKYHNKKIWRLLFSLSLICVILSLSRGGMLGIGIASLVIIIGKIKKNL